MKLQSRFNGFLFYILSKDKLTGISPVVFSDLAFLVPGDGGLTPVVDVVLLQLWYIVSSHLDSASSESTKNAISLVNLLENVVVTTIGGIGNDSADNNNNGATAKTHQAEKAITHSVTIIEVYYFFVVIKDTTF